MHNRYGESDEQCTEPARFGFIEQKSNGLLKLYLLPKDSDTGGAPIDMIVELSRYCGFKESGENAVLLSHILSGMRTSAIEDYLRGKGLPFELQGEDADIVGKASYRKDGESWKKHIDHLTSLRYIEDTKRGITSPCPLSRYAEWLYGHAVSVRVVREA
jgi:hypothetical protein